MADEGRDPLAALRAMIDQLNIVPAPRTESIKLTRAQFDRLRAGLPAGVASDPAAAYFGTPIVLVESTTRSTPYIEGWIKCPSCGKPAAGHNEAQCSVRLVFSRFGDFAVSSPILLELEGHRRIEADRREQATALPRWEDDGGSYE